MGGTELAHLEHGGAQTPETCCFGGKVTATSFTTCSSHFHFKE